LPVGSAKPKARYPQQRRSGVRQMPPELTFPSVARQRVSSVEYYRCPQTTENCLTFLQADFISHGNFRAFISSPIHAPFIFDITHNIPYECAVLFEIIDVSSK
jgi:hypothetical protein